MKFGKLTVLSMAGKNKWGNLRWLCRCDCGKETITLKKDVLSGKAKSCGCRVKTHGMSSYREYNNWRVLKQRCQKAYNKNYPAYGGRGIIVCERWASSFEAFVEDMGLSPSLGHTIDRVNNNLGYSKDNCRWATRAEQARNKTNNRHITIFGETKCLSDWGADERCAVHRNTFVHRLNKGWKPEDALTRTPIRC